jgi:hypothetical protein
MPTPPGMKGIVTYVTIEQWKQLRHISIDRDRSLEQLVGDAVTELLNNAQKSATRPQLSRDGKTPTRRNNSARGLANE